MPLVSVSNDQRKPLPLENYVATIHDGIPPDLYRPSFEQGSYLAFLGRISPKKRPDRAIRIARAAGISVATFPTRPHRAASSSFVAIVARHELVDVDGLGAFERDRFEPLRR
jgi:hypothetical protein